jgi:hypothetical protein
MRPSLFALNDDRIVTIDNKALMQNQMHPQHGSFASSRHTSDLQEQHWYTPPGGTCEVSTAQGDSFSLGVLLYDVGLHPTALDSHPTALDSHPTALDLHPTALNLPTSLDSHPTALDCASVSIPGIVSTFARVDTLDSYDILTDLFAVTVSFPLHG